MSTSSSEKIDIFNSLSIDLTTKELDQIEEKNDKLKELENKITKNIKATEESQEKSILNLVNINVTDFKKMDFDQFKDVYKLDLKISLKTDNSVFIVKELNTTLKKE
ncbi:hypothetical protein [Spiroplasma cantharicola]|uniref:Uncharacterized protein n=1 Tax=Spiroplasma cantharicola TaxID=362837 RepID=A0A0M4JJ81_9MOLU|nr:hypothetical protein [Spiroplasma cantharicola]ALD66199.1 hypothetical protein SCANT_v1c02890 [Spiroplasma cantharicola]